MIQWINGSILLHGRLTTDNGQHFAYNHPMTDERERLTAMVKAAG